MVEPLSTGGLTITLPLHREDPDNIHVVSPAKPIDESRAEADAFEREVRRIAAQRFPSGEGLGPVLVDGRERDCLLITEDAAIAIETTTSREKSKAEHDGKKLKALTAELARKHPYKAIKGYFITRAEPTADQIDVIRRIGPPVVAMSFARFRSGLIDTNGYLAARDDSAFGSARDPETNSAQVRDKYVDLEFADVVDRRQQYQLSDIFGALESGGRVVILGDYGTGKSMTLREVYFRSKAKHSRQDDARFCIHLSLSEHQAQTDPAEALMRHGNGIGFPHPNQLIRAWRSGMAHLLLDGFDEVLVTGRPMEGRRPLVDLRNKSVALIRNFIKETPQESGILIAGRDNFFDSVDELKRAFSLAQACPLIVSATDFTEEQVEQYLRNRSWSTTLPDWLPRRPLLIGYLAGRKLFESIEGLSESAVGEGWHNLLQQIAEREARSDADADADLIRQILERLATLARRTSSGLGPLQFEDLVTVFRELRGNIPDEGAYGVLQRLPGLHVSDAQTGTRSFVDSDFVDAARAGDIVRWIVEVGTVSDERDSFADWMNLLGDVGLEVLSFRMNQLGVTERALQAATARAIQHPRNSGLVADITRLLFVRGITPVNRVTITNAHVPSLFMADGCNGSGVTFDQCIIDVLDLSSMESAELLPTFVDCSIEVVEGVVGIDELATDRVVGCTFGRFSESTETMSSILKLELPDYSRVAMTLLRKIFVQSGHSRKESALYRGSLTMKQKDLISDVLHDLKGKGAIRRIRRRDSTFWEPNRLMYRRVRKLLDAPTSTTDELVRPGDGSRSANTQSPRSDGNV
jgi:hypothetical protein